MAQPPKKFSRDEKLAMAIDTALTEACKDKRTGSLAHTSEGAGETALAHTRVAINLAVYRSKLRQAGG